LTPQLLYRHLIEKSRGEGTSIALKELYANNAIEFKEFSSIEHAEGNIVVDKLFANTMFQHNLNDVISVEQEWIYNPRNCNIHNFADISVYCGLS